MLRKKLLVLTSTFPRWVDDHEPPFVFELCQRLQEHFDVTVLAPHTLNAATIEHIDGIEVRRFRYFFDKWEKLAYQGGIMAKLKQHIGYYLLVPFFLLGQIFALYGILRREKIDIIHAHWLIPQGLVCVICRLLLRKEFPPLLCTSHGSDLQSLQGAFFSGINRKVLHDASIVTVVSETMKQQAVALTREPERIFVIPMGIDAITDFTPAPQIERSATDLLFVGRLVESKAADVLINAMPAILAERPDVKLLIAGDGPQKRELIILANALGIHKNVHFLGTVSKHELPAFYRRAAVFISPSVSEGFGLTIAEALACECAVIVSDLPAIREIVNDGTTGIIVPPRDSSAIAKNTLALLDNSSLRGSLGKAGRESVLRKFDWTIISAHYTYLIHQLNTRAAS